MSLVLLFRYLLLNMFRMLVHPSSGACHYYYGFISCVVLLWFDVCWCYGVVWLGWCGILMLAEALRLIMDLFHVLNFSGSMCVGVTVWFGWGGVVYLCWLKHCDLLWIYFMCCIVLVRCVLVLRCGSAGVVWYPYAG